MPYRDPLPTMDWHPSMCEHNYSQRWMSYCCRRSHMMNDRHRKCYCMYCSWTSSGWEPRSRSDVRTLHRLQKNSLTRDLRTFEIRSEFESAVRFYAKGIGRFENFRIESAVPAPLLVVSLVKRLKQLTALRGTVYRLAIALGVIIRR